MIKYYFAIYIKEAYLYEVRISDIKGDRCTTIIRSFAFFAGVLKQYDPSENTFKYFKDDYDSLERCAEEFSKELPLKLGVRCSKDEVIAKITLAALAQN